MGSEGDDPLTDKKNQRKKRTSTSQYMMYLEMMEEDPIFAGGKHPRDLDPNYLSRKWKELSAKLNTCNTGPKLTAEEWKKRLNDWKNTTRCKYRRHVNGENVTITSMESRALDLFGKIPPSTGQIQLKEEKIEEDLESEHQRSSDTLQKQLQAAVDEAIRDGDNEEEDEENNVIQEESDDPEIITGQQTAVNTRGGETIMTRGTITNTGQNNTTTYRTIVVENAAQYAEEDNIDEFISHRRQLAPATVVTTSTPGTTVTKLINGDIPLKRLRSQASDQIIYEVKKAPTTQRLVTVHNTGVGAQYQTVHQAPPQQHRTIELGNSYSLQAPAQATNTPLGITSQDAREIARQLKRMADIKAEKLKFDVARFKFNNPGFNFNLHL